MIAQRAGASKASLYSRFPTKEELFIAVLEHRMDHIFQGVSSTDCQDAPLREALPDLGTELLQSALSDAQIALIRIIGMEAVRFPQLGARFFELGPARGLAVLSRLFETQIKKRVLGDENPQMMAQLLVGMLAGPPLLQRLLGITTPLEQGKQLNQHLEGAIDAFLRAYGA